MPRRGGRSSLGRTSLWPSTYQTARDACIVLGSIGGTTMATSSVWVGLGLFCGAIAGHRGLRLYNERWQRLQDELFRRHVCDGTCYHWERS